MTIYRYTKEGIIKLKSCPMDFLLITQKSTTTLRGAIQLDLF